MRTNGNQVERDILAWRKQEEQIHQIFSPTVVNSRAFRLEKLRQLDGIYYTHAGTASKEEGLTLKLLNIERKQLEKQLFPHFLDRLFRRLGGNAKKLVAIRQWEQQQSRHDQLLRHTLVSAGFGSINWQQFHQQAQRGDPSFTIQHTYSNSTGKKVDFELSFSKDQKGLYHFDKYSAMLTPGSRPDQARKQTFSVDADNSITAMQAANLLAGRVVQQQYTNVVGARQGVWLQLDFNDRDSQGNFKLKQFHSDMDIEKTLQELPFREKMNTQAMDKLLQGLRNGEPQTITLEKDGVARPVAIAVNPQLKTLDLLNEQGKKVSLAEALGENKEKSQLVQFTQDMKNTPSRKTGLSVR